MPDPTNTAERVEQQFDIDQALNNKNFLKFLGKHPDAGDFDMKNPAEVGKRFETFEKKGVAAEGLKQVYKDHIEKSMDIKLSPADLEAIEDEIERRAIESPEDVATKVQELAQFVEVSTSVKELWNQLDASGAMDPYGDPGTLRTELESLKRQQDALGLAKRYLGFAGKGRLLFDVLTFPKPSLKNLKNIWEQKKQLEDEFKVTTREQADSLEENTIAQIGAYEQKISEINDLGQKFQVANESFLALQKKLLGEMGGFEAFTSIIQKKSVDSLNEMMTKGTISSFAKAQERIQKLGAFREQSATGVDPLENMNEDVFAGTLDMMAEEKATEHIKNAITGAKLGNNALSNLEKIITENVLKENLGTKDEQETKEFVAQTIEEVREGLPDNDDGRMKKVMLARILVKLQS